MDQQIVLTKEEYEKLKEFQEFKNKKQQYNKLYFATATKSKSCHCDVCKIDVKYSSFVNHKKSKKHLKALLHQFPNAEPQEEIQIE